MPQRWFQPKNKLVPEVQSVLYQAVEEIRERSVFEGHEGSVTSVAFSRDGQYFVSGRLYKALKLWRGTDWKDWLEYQFTK